MKFIFLDIDGVMNLNKTFKLKDRKNKLYGTDSLEIDNKRVRMLKQLIDDTGAKIVLSSGWRDGFFVILGTLLLQIFQYIFLIGSKNILNSVVLSSMIEQKFLRLNVVRK